MLGGRYGRGTDVLMRKVVVGGAIVLMVLAWKAFMLWMRGYLS